MVLRPPRNSPVEAAARVNAYMGDIFELNDLIGGHASIGNVSALLALAESIGATGGQLVEAVVVGLEVTARVYNGYYPAMKPYDEVGMNPVVFPSSYGVAAGAARLMGLTEAQLGDAMGIAGTLAGVDQSGILARVAQNDSLSHRRNIRWCERNLQTLHDIGGNQQRAVGSYRRLLR